MSAEDLKYYSNEDLNDIIITDYFTDILKEMPDYNYTMLNRACNSDNFAFDTADSFIQGSCQLFAYALKEQEPKFKVCRIGNHIFCKYENLYIDVRGKTDSFKMFTRDLYDKRITFDNSTLYSFVTEDFKEEYGDIAFCFAKVIILRDKDRYLLDGS